MGERHNESITGMAAGVPFTALPPTVTVDGPTPLVLAWHMLDAPCTDAAFAAALPLRGVPAWRVYLGMPLCGARMIENSMDAVIALARKDPLMAYLAPFVWQAAEEFPAALAALRQQLPVDTALLGVLGGSLGGMVVLQILARSQIPIAAAAVVNPAVRVRSAVGLVGGGTRRPYPWNAESRTAADRLDFVARAEDIAARAPQPPLLVLSGELDYPVSCTDAAELVGALRERYAQPDHIQLTTVPDLAHPLAEPPGLQLAPQLPTAKAVDEAITQWFLHHLTTH
jgi:pimeloyl-ACP methyl ester carboxylesterase